MKGTADWQDQAPPQQRSGDEPARPVAQPRPAPQPKAHFSQLQNARIIDVPARRDCECVLPLARPQPRGSDQRGGPGLPEPRAQAVRPAGPPCCMGRRTDRVRAAGGAGVGGVVHFLRAAWLMTSLWWRSGRQRRRASGPWQR